VIRPTNESEDKDKFDGISIELHVERFGKENGANHATFGGGETWTGRIATI
jgi:hypothetical protein